MTRKEFDSTMPRGWRDVPTYCQAQTLESMGNVGHDLFAVQSWYLPSVLKAILVRGWAISRKLKVYRTNSGMVALARYRKQHGSAML